MTTEQLKKGNDLHSVITCRERDLLSIKKALKEIELDEYSMESIELKLDRSVCRLNKKRMAEFLFDEISIETKSLKEDKIKLSKI